MLLHPLTKKKSFFFLSIPILLSIRLLGEISVRRKLNVFSENTKSKKTQVKNLNFKETTLKSNYSSLEMRIIIKNHL